MDNLKYLIIGCVIILLYFTFKKIKKRIMVRKDYNRKISKEDLKVRKDLEILRNQLFQSDDPAVNNELLNKIQAITKSNSKVKGDRKF